MPVGLDVLRTISEVGCWAVFVVAITAYFHHLRECPRSRLYRRGPH